MMFTPPDNVRIGKFFQNSNFFNDSFPLLFLSSFDVFGSVGPLVILVLDLEHNSELAPPQLLLLFVLLEVNLPAQ